MSSSFWPTYRPSGRRSEPKSRRAKRSPLPPSYGQAWYTAHAIMRHPWKKSDRRAKQRPLAALPSADYDTGHHRHEPNKKQLAEVIGRKAAEEIYGPAAPT